MSHKDGRVVLSAWVDPVLRDHAREAARLSGLEFSRWVARAVRQTMARESVVTKQKTFTEAQIRKVVESWGIVADQLVRELEVQASLDEIDRLHKVVGTLLNDHSGAYERAHREYERASKGHEALARVAFPAVYRAIDEAKAGEESKR